jgi:hypothetical protein
MTAPAEGQQDARPFSELRDSGLLWLINRVVFHPRGFALGLVVDDAGEVTGWCLHGDGSEVWQFELPDGEDALFAAAEQTLRSGGGP